MSAIYRLGWCTKDQSVVEGMLEVLLGHGATYNMVAKIPECPFRPHESFLVTPLEYSLILNNEDAFVALWRAGARFVPHDGYMSRHWPVGDVVGRTVAYWGKGFWFSGEVWCRALDPASLNVPSWRLLDFLRRQGHLPTLKTIRRVAYRRYTRPFTATLVRSYWISLKNPGAPLTGWHCPRLEQALYEWHYNAHAGAFSPELTPHLAIAH